MQILDIIWLPHVVDKLLWKHNVTPEEIEDVLFDKPKYRKIQKGHIPGEDLYTALGQTESGRYLIVFLIYKPSREALIISDRDMNYQERKIYERT